MVNRPCLDCGKLGPSSRCPDCTRTHMAPRYAAKDARRGTGRQRYDAQHDTVRARLLPKAYGKPCPRCHEPMLAGQALDFGHPEDRPRCKDRTARAERIEHASCNRSAGAA